jgi:2,4-dienoyl-CoA reductase-like NADH-dependent reductase (Old Yellow Enzyme family)
MSKLFESATIHRMTVPNRFVRSATWEGMATADGAATPKLVDAMAALARGGVGLIVSGHAYVRPEGQAGPFQLGAHKDELVPGLRRMVDAAHGNGAKIALQMAHAGCFAAEALSGLPPLAVSESVPSDEAPRQAMSVADIESLVAAFAAAAARAKEAGFDAVQIHSAHGYLLSQFLSPLHNRRTDAYGGPVANRCRVHREVLAAVRRAVGPDFPVLAKVNCEDFVEGGLTAADALEATLMLEADGLDAVELSGGVLGSIKMSPARMGIKSEEKEAYHRQQAAGFREKLRLPLILVGGIRSLELAERFVDEGLCDFISMSRPFIREPGLVARWRAGDRRKAECKSDNLCFGPGSKGTGIYCVSREREKKPA